MSAESQRRPRVMGALLLFTVFVAGIAVGFALHRLARPEPRIRTIRAADVSGVLEKLGLSAEQRVRAESIMQRRTPAAEAMMQEVADRLGTISDSVDRELRSILTPAQRARLDSLRAKSNIMLKRKITVGGTTHVDTLFPSLPRTP